jgi:hypothetical protein
MKKQLLFIIFISMLNTALNLQATDTQFKRFINSFETLSPPINCKKLATNKEHKNFIISSKEAIKYLKMKKEDLYYWEGDEAMDPPHTISQEKIDCTPIGVFKYALNDSIWIVCTYQYKGEQDTTSIVLHSFNKTGKLLDRCVIGGDPGIASRKYSSNFIVLSENNVRMFVYADTLIDKKSKKYSAMYNTIDYKINSHGKFMQENTSDKKLLMKEHFVYYTTYNSNSDDPMNKY